MKIWAVLIGVMIIAAVGIYYYSNPWTAQKIAGNTIPVKFDIKISKGAFADPNMDKVTVTKVSSCGWGNSLNFVTGSVDSKVTIATAGYAFDTNTINLAGDWNVAGDVTACQDIPPGKYEFTFTLDWKQGDGSWDRSEQQTRTLSISSAGVTEV